METETDHTYTVDGTPLTLRLSGAEGAEFGPDRVLASPDTDPTWGQPWYQTGFAVSQVFSPAEFADLKTGIRNTLVHILSDLGVDLGDAPIEQYHRFVDDDLHYKVVGRTRDLFPSDFNLDIAALHERLGAELGFPVSDIWPPTGEQVHIIIRVNRPGSDDFNPVHKDIYEDVDHADRVPRMINFWIPICGVGPQSALPLAAGSHLLSEAEILRTRAGSIMQGKHYRVNSILTWGGQTALERVRITDGEVLMFSSHLIHGLGYNTQPDTTRIALEFRLFETEPPC
ncbi:phytanoyl-CoA dioxygenase [Ponticoccus sp. SC2-23]|uniref:phytanoyl-CoA dioxygenase family protein n=1 Tax=Alexandriicola marinus TaxID=2081710 RepID=UPI000FD6C2E6|nr:phytanoyl-CoA dioxygenase family protein [Alexandriicola marinus]MBM1219521.1 phytanoyl-CoA dioxygenase [Ponticoccus sp. SC6-9]MBM1223407.1 phytanoyl-CoA dioxygenase [Ponticoccus sp. SC6-15]MBM1229334.1 phytanoyl-CoA dioxygenase [Ponticoccus sp. SC6-38]MBM1232373.1 phytanoyl-CoA dioxygenase [Ponticoccus sp. SC6-45]MBM1237677.1 phytanoyl-CoA dioxygenase [Ponticoccus sp. SC6-49]MBM1241384.1 phytanoyl-CoA dioxygenase [Ponticoccus sp. SC2-64]MBM1245897.1 phytanoyl-CoA dioxygenase [Ponticoccus